jgi:hypothetical protein
MLDSAGQYRLGTRGTREGCRTGSGPWVLLVLAGFGLVAASSLAGEVDAPGNTAGTALTPGSPPAESPRLDQRHGVDLFAGPANPEQARQIAACTRRLGSPDHALRERATADLSAMGVVALRHLREVYRASDDLEVRLRIEVVVEQVYLTTFFFQQNGFLGVSQNTRVLRTHRDLPAIPEGAVGIEVVQVVPGTAADRAGLLSGDIIAGLDGQPLEGVVAEDAVTAFGDRIRKQGPGTEVLLTVLRREVGQWRMLELPAVLGVRPLDAYNLLIDSPISRDWQAAQRDFLGWWEEEFRGEASPGDLPTPPH